MGDSPVIIFPVVKSLVLHVGARPASVSLCWGAAPGAGEGEGLGICGAAVTSLCDSEGLLQLLLLGLSCFKGRNIPWQGNGTQLHEAGAPGPSLASLREDVMGTGRLYSALPCWSELHGLGMKVRGRKPCGGRGEFTW